MINDVDIKNMEIDLLKKRLEAVALLASSLVKMYVPTERQTEVNDLVDKLSHTKGGKYDG